MKSCQFLLPKIKKEEVKIVVNLTNIYKIYLFVYIRYIEQDK